MIVLKQLASPPKFYALASSVWPWLTGLGGLILLAGLIVGLLVAPADAVQGEVYRAIYVHVATAWMSMFLYLVACGYAVLHWVYRTDVSAVMMRAILPTGGWMTLVALVTGALWGKPTWGTYWVWDARMTSELLLLFIYLGLIALGQLAADPSKSDRLLSIGLLLAAVNIPLIYFSVIFWNTLHQGYSVSLSGSHLDTSIAWGMWLSVLGVWFWCAGTVLNRARHLLVLRRGAFR
ncbi:MAG TPA: cytochrome c biogenesis protein CcsA [Limnobacter sp.]|uniref:cytochrome c biogenesis protein CcsA n=1 Tax=Limnobacter sp. TaxID=2003368 RepID=UPI002E36D782|nr:cytochrome c biogenesis protein CcsA [Limnobacter sp.]HEX5485335.1 cytochrome c biogenesis protein CcsA [Limnobacter sp.]